MKDKIRRKFLLGMFCTWDMNNTRKIGWRTPRDGNDIDISLQISVHTFHTENQYSLGDICHRQFHLLHSAGKWDWNY